MKKFKRTRNGKEIIIELLKLNEIKSINKLSPITQVSALCFNKEGKILIVSSKKGKWGLPGGKPKINETLEQALKRECYEEASATLKKVLPIAVIKVHFPSNPNKKEGDIFYQIRYLALIDSILPSKKDPATGIKFKRKFIKPKEFTKYVKWPEASLLLAEAIKKVKELQ